jgi:hypothetical protein
LDHLVYCHLDPPPLLKGRDILIRNQVFRLWLVLVNFLSNS